MNIIIHCGYALNVLQTYISQGIGGPLSKRSEEHLLQ